MTPYFLTGFRRLLSPARRFCFPSIPLGVAIVIAALPAMGQTSGTVAARARSITPHIRAYAQVQPIGTLPLNAAENGVLSGLSIVPGMHVHAGQKLASLQGAGIQSQISQDEATLRSARTQLAAAEKTLAIQREQMRAHLSTRESLHRAVSAVAQAQANFDNAQSRLGTVHQLASITAPVNSIVMALDSANGELVSAGQAVVTLQPAGDLWLRATYYGKDLSQIHTGMSGTFSPSDESAPVAVRVQSLSGVMSAGGGESIMMIPLHSPVRWINGEFGTVTLNALPIKAVGVPTRALILNQGHWWVMIHTSHGDHPQEVVPGRSRGWDTYITQGLAPGTQVIVKNAYLLFHASITEHFQIPD